MIFLGAFSGEVFAQQGRARGPGARGPYGPWPIWALAHMGLGPYGPWPIWAMSQIFIFKPGLYLNQILYLKLKPDFIFKPYFYIKNSR